jgi:hypothetical protein
MMAAYRVIFAGACLLLAGTTSAHADVEVVSTDGCLEAAAVQERIESALASRLEQPDRVTVLVEGVAAAGGGTTARLRVTTRRGRVLLDRRHELAARDCVAATELFAVVVDRLFTRLRVEEWNEPPQATSSTMAVATRAAAPVPSNLELTLVSAASASPQPAGGDVEVGVRFDRGRTRWRVGGGVLIRQSLPSELGTGDVRALSSLATAGLRRVARGWQATVELRAGAMRLAGSGFDDNRADWLSWAEAGGSLAWVGRHVTVGLVVSGSPLSRRAVTIDRMETQAIPRVRLGLGLTFPLWRENP